MTPDTCALCLHMQAELEELQQQLREVQQQRDGAADALHAVKAELQAKLDGERTEAAQLREQLQQSALDAQVQQP